MIEECPFCGSIRIVETLKGDKRICLACETFLNDKSKPTVFDRITASPEVLAEKLVYKTLCVGVNRVTYSCWKSTITEESYRTKEEAIAATVARLKEQAK